MGNNASARTGGKLSAQYLDYPGPHQWAHSFPRDLQRMPQQFKVLPEDGINQRLRTTDNGAILTAEGTIRGHRQSFISNASDPDAGLSYNDAGIYRSHSISRLHEPNDFPRTTKPYAERNLRSFKHPDRDPKAFFGSEPDLRVTGVTASATDAFGAKNRGYKPKKKYKAPAPPFGTKGERTLNDQWEMNSTGDTGSETGQANPRRSRLFKTRVETHRIAQKSQETDETYYSHNVQSVQNAPNIQTKIAERTKRKDIPPMQRSVSSPEFQAELRAVTQKLRHIDRSVFEMKDDAKKVEKDVRKEDRKEKMKTMDHNNITTKQKLMTVVKGTSERPREKETRPRANETRSVANETRPLAGQKKDAPPTKTFYFGMNDKTDAKNRKTAPKKRNEDVIERPQAKEAEIDTRKTRRESENANHLRRSSSESALSSSETEFDDGTGSNDISLQLRPTLPKKQLEIPRFSPATAWRLLSVYDAPDEVHYDDGPSLPEARIEKSQRQVPSIPLLMNQRSSYDKSGDSGISGDAGPPLIEDIPEPIAFKPPVIARNPPLIAWTPQQDLEEGSSSDDGAVVTKGIDEAPKFSARSHVFSLSLPREGHLLPYASDKSRPPPSFNSLQKLKRSIGAAMRPKLDEPGVDDNWFLSSSAPNSINHAAPRYKLSQTQSIDEDDDEEKPEETSPEIASSTTSMLKTPSFTYLATGGHVMYLPTTDKNPRNSRAFHESRANPFNDPPERRSSAQLLPPHPTRPNKQERAIKSRSVMDKSFFERDPSPRNLRDIGKARAKSCENIDNEMRQLNRTPSPEFKNPKFHDTNLTKTNSRNGKKFTFQSTVRQIERRRIAEKLSKEAERKERQRLSELEAMQKVEEEFQRKRAKEKASIRQQLRLFSLEDGAGKWETDAGKVRRTEPDGAVSSPAPSPTSNDTQDGNNNKYGKGTDSRLDAYQRKISDQSEYFHGYDGNVAHGDGFYAKNDYGSGDGLNRRFLRKDVTRASPISRLSDDSRIKTPATEVLSEFRQPTREYKDFRGFSRFNPEKNVEAQTVIHPPVVCNMPRATHGGYFHEERSPSPISDNYRRDFAHGAIPTSSDSELSQPSSIRPHSPKHLSSRYRARSSSPKPVANRTQTDRMETSNTLDRTHADDFKRTRSMTTNRTRLSAPVQPRHSVSYAKRGDLVQARPYEANKTFKSVVYNVE